MVDPFLNRALHTHFLEPVDIVGRGAGIRRASHQRVDFILRVVVAHLDIVYTNPIDEFRMVNDIFLKRIAGFVGVVDTDSCIIGFTFLRRYTRA